MVILVNKDTFLFIKICTCYSLEIRHLVWKYTKIWNCDIVGIFVDIIPAYE